MAWREAYSTGAFRAEYPRDLEQGARFGGLLEQRLQPPSQPFLEDEVRFTFRRTP